MYCQRDIENQSICENQCVHCKSYYAPLEEQSAIREYADMMNPDAISSTQFNSDLQWNRDANAFEAGIEFAKKYYNACIDDESDKVF